MSSRFRSVIFCHVSQSTHLDPARQHRGGRGVHGMAKPVADRFRLEKKLGSGAFGNVYLGTDLTNGKEVAIKAESIRATRLQLHYESRIYQFLEGGEGIPRMLWFGKAGEYNLMAMELLGPSLEDVFNFCARRFSLKTVLLLADQCICRLEHIHSQGFLHRDVKPNNFLMGLDDRRNVVYALDFGLSKKYRDFKTHVHIPYRTGKNLTGTARYASLRTHLGIEQGRRDDMESLGFMLMYFLRGKLPWQNIRAKTKKEKTARIAEMKSSTPMSVLCEGFPEEFAAYLTACRKLEFDAAPDYAALRKLFRDVYEREGYARDNVYDWTWRIREQRARALRQRVPLPSSGASKAVVGASTTPPSHAPPTSAPGRAPLCPA
eukprot:m.460178 g.460178  ORF g.460178 m.460178 type:complete len:376 (+) comp21957_c0_seq1:130-1257(+)